MLAVRTALSLRRRESAPRHALARAVSGRGLPFFSILATFAVAGSAVAAPSHCDDVPPSERGLCRMVLSCSAIDDAERREQCFRAAAETAEATAAAGDADADAPPAVEERSPVPVVEPEAAPKVPTATAPKDATAPAPAEAPAPNVVRREVVEQEVLDIPERFVAEVATVRSLVRNRQLLVLEGGLLFETDRAEQSRIEVGDQVRVTRASSLFGRRYRIIGPARAAVTGTRLRCERIELGTDTRRKCALLDGQGAGRD